MRILRLIRQKRGQALVEFALILPVLVVIFAATVELGRAWSTKQVITEASRVGARLGSLPNTTEYAVRQAVIAQLRAGGLDPSQATIETQNVGVNGQRGDDVVVTVRYPFRVLAGSIVPGLRGTITLESSTVMMHE